MVSQLKPHLPAKPVQRFRRRRRAAWRQRLVEAERGITHGFRGDSTLFGYLFAGSVVVTTGLVLGLSLSQWTLLILAMTVVLSAELFQQALKAVLPSGETESSPSFEKGLKIGTAGVFVAIGGAVLVVSLIFGSRLVEMFGGA